MSLVPIQPSAAAVKATAEFLERFGGISGFVESLLNVPAGYLQHWHQENLIRWHDRLLTEAAKRKAGGRTPIPLSILMPALQKIAMEDDDDLLGLWARLFANFQDPEHRIAPNKIYVHVLSEMQPVDAKLLQHIVAVLPETRQAVAGMAATPIGIMHTTLDELGDEIGVSELDLLLSLHNLNRLGCLLVRPVDPAHYVLAESSPAPIPQVPTIITEDGTYYLSTFGSTLVQACSGG